MTILIIFIFILIIAAIGIIVIRNNLVVSREEVKNAWSQINVQLQRRFDLIPNLVETVKGYMTHESEVLEKVTQLRTSWITASSIEDRINADKELSESLKKLLAISENYPDLKANTNFITLQNELSNTEDKISFCRNFYNDAVTKYNTKLEVFPSNTVASIFGMESEPLFEISNPEVLDNVKVDFNE